MLSAWRRAFRDCMATTVINCGKLCSILHATRECNKKQHWRRTCGQHPWANKNQQRKILPVSQPSTDSITMTSMTVRKAKYAKCIKATAQIPDCRKLSCFHALAGGLAIQGCICSHWSQDIFKRNIKNDKAVPRLHLKRTSWVPAVDPLQASRGVYIKLYHRYSPDWHGPAKLWICKSWNISKMDPIKESFYFDLPARQQEPSWEVLIVLGRTPWGYLALHSVTGSRSELLKSKWTCCHEKHALVGSYSQLIAQKAVLNACHFHGEGNSM